MTNVLVTGGCGFIGSHIVDKLISEGNNVLVLDNCSTGKNINSESHLYQLDISQLSVKELMVLLKTNKVEYVFHLAAQINLRNSFDDPVFDAQTNIMGTIALATAANNVGVKRFIFASTGGAIYSELTDPPWTEDSPAGPQSPYGLSKFCSEKYLQLLYPDMSAIMRFSNVYGPRQNPHGEAGVVAIFLNNILNGEVCRIFGDGTQVRDYVFVDDVVEACTVAMTQNLSGIYNVSTGAGTDLNTLTLLLLSKSGMRASIKYEDAKPGEMKRSILLPSKLLTHTSWTPRVNVEEGLQKTIEWFTGK